MTPDRSGLFLPKKRGSRGTGAPCKQDRGINAEYPSKHHRKLVWTKLANDYLTLTALSYFLTPLFLSYIINVDIKLVFGAVFGARHQIQLLVKSV
jgi:hypothetical protein